MNKKRLTIIIGIVGAILILAGIFIFSSSSPSQENESKPNIFTKELTPLELSQNKENFQGKTIIVKGAFIPSEAFIYVKETQDKIYLKPANRDYCKEYDLTGILEYRSDLSRWEFYPENYDNCVK